MDSDPCSQLPHFWFSAASPTPILIVGGGRWAKVWASVIAGARGNIEHMAMAARTDPPAVRAWAAREPGFEDLVVCESIAQALERNAELAVAIVCSRPQDHLADTLEAFRCGLHVLVEKPISTDADNALRMLAACQQAQRRFAVGAEFAYVPALHQCAHAWGLRRREQLEMRLVWNDPAVEYRYGATKSRHPEVNAVVDLLPHAFSVFRTLAPEGELHIAEVTWQNGGSSGRILFRDQASSVFTLMFDVAASERTRRVEVDAGPDGIAIDFSEKLSVIEVNGKPHALDPRLVPLTSTLRLQLGAFVASLPKRPSLCGTADPSILALIRVQQELEAFLS